MNEKVQFNIIEKQIFNYSLLINLAILFLKLLNLQDKIIIIVYFFILRITLEFIIK